MRLQIRISWKDIRAAAAWSRPTDEQPFRPCALELALNRVTGGRWFCSLTTAWLLPQGTWEGAIPVRLTKPLRLWMRAARAEVGVFRLPVPESVVRLCEGVADEHEEANYSTIINVSGIRRAPIDPVTHRV